MLHEARDALQQMRDGEADNDRCQHHDVLEHLHWSPLSGSAFLTFIAAQRECMISLRTFNEGPIP